MELAEFFGFLREQSLNEIQPRGLFTELFTMIAAVMRA
jgi:hypothetical protein